MQNSFTTDYYQVFIGPATVTPVEHSCVAHLNALPAIVQVVETFSYIFHQVIFPEILTFHLSYYQIHADMEKGIYTIENRYLNVSVASKGAELQSLIHKYFGIEYMWSGDAAFWGKKSPVLFPVVGGLKQNRYTYNGREYQMSRHGFARDMEFVLTGQSGTSLIFTLYNNAETELIYPFQFNFSVGYELEESRLLVSYSVKNTGNGAMFFSVGAHPAFCVPLVPETRFEDYYLEFNKIEEADRWPLSPEGQIDLRPIPCLKNTNKLPLQKSLFYHDAIVFKELASTAISIKSGKTTHGLTLGFEGFPFMGIWNAKDADFICIEPWCGIADQVNASGILSEKEGIIQLQPDDIFERTWTVGVF